MKVILISLKNMQVFAWCPCSKVAIAISDNASGDGSGCCDGSGGGSGVDNSGIGL